MPQKSTRTRSTSRAKQTRKPRFHERVFESDGTYLLKLIVVLILSTVWIKFFTPFFVGGIPITAFPLGVCLGLLVVRAFEHHQEDRKIWYAVLIIGTIVSYFLPAGIVV